MTRPFVFSLIGFLLVTVSATAAPLRPDSLLSADTDLVVFIRDVGALREHVKASPWADLAQVVPDTLRYRTEKIGLKSVGDLLSGLTGPVILTVDLGNLTLEDLEGNTDVERRMAVLAGSENEERFRFLAKEGPMVWETAGVVSILSGSGAYMDELSKAVRQGPQGPVLAGDPDFRAFREYTGDVEAYVYLSLEVPIRLAREGLRKLEGIAADTRPEAAGFGQIAERTLDALDLDALHAFGLGLSVSRTDTHLATGLLASGDRGLMKLMAYLPGPCPRLPFIPEEAMSAAVTRYDIPAVWDGLWDLARAVSPSGTDTMEARINRFTAAAGVNLRRDVIGNLGKAFFSVGFPTTAEEEIPGQPEEQVFGLALKDRETLEFSIQTLLTVSGIAEALQTREVEGTTVYGLTSSPAAGAKHVSFAFTDAYFVFGLGDPGHLDTILRSMRHPGRSIWERSNIEPHLREFPEDASSISVSDIGWLFRRIYDTQAIEDRQYIDKKGWERLGSEMGLAVGSTTKTPAGIFSTVLLTHRKR